MKLVYIIPFCLALAGCETIQKLDQTTATRYKYVVTQIPDEVLKVPNPMYKIDPKTATDKEMAKWMADSEQRYLEIERKLREVKEYQEKKLKDLKVPPEDIIRN